MPNDAIPCSQDYCPVNYVRDDIKQIKEAQKETLELLSDHKAVLTEIANLKKDVLRNENDIDTLYSRVRDVESSASQRTTTWLWDIIKMGIVFGLGIMAPVVISFIKTVLDLKGG